MRDDAPRRDIQGLRAVAVVMVVLVHFWPHRLTGGYVGVDVFFVISGFLITDHLLRKPPTSPRLLAAFWARRVRRLLPAATLVLGVTVMASLAWLPDTLLPQTLRHAGAAAVYVANWAMVRDATDYLAAQEPPTAVQHYWSLSVEEQFYLLWPLLIAALVVMGRRVNRHAALLWAGVLTVFGGSLVISIMVTASNHVMAYYATQVRMWELALGAIVALWAATATPMLSPKDRLRSLTAWLGLGVVALAGLTFDARTPFPGWMALLPTLGAAAVIAAAADECRWSPSVILGLRPVQWLGDVSYSVYLWHWPVVVIAPFALGVKALTWPQKLMLLALVMLISGLTKVFVEDRLRYQRGIVRTLPRSFALGAVCSVVVVTVCAGLLVNQQRQQQADQRVVDHIAHGYVPCAGADAVANPACSGKATPQLTSPAFAKQDKSVLYADNCWNGRPFTDRRVCQYPSAAGGAATIALLGNSHAGHWFPALDKAATEHGWAVSTYVSSECYPVRFVRLEFGNDRLSEHCQQWNQWAIGAIVSSKPSLVVISNRSYAPIIGVDPGQQMAAKQAAYADTLSAFTHAGIPVVVIRDTPAFDFLVPDCLAQDRRSGRVSCQRPASQVVAMDPLALAAQADRSGLVRILDVTPLLCPEGVCQSQIGGVIVYFDRHHLTATFAATMAPQLGQAIREALRNQVRLAG